VTLSEQSSVWPVLLSVGTDVSMPSTSTAMLGAEDADKSFSQPFFKSTKRVVILPVFTE
jgi:hypothetical protein